MAFVSIVVLSYPAGMESEIEERFAHRHQNVDKFEGFEGFEMLRPVSGGKSYFVITRWADEASYQKRMDARAEREDTGEGLSVEPLGFEVVDLG
ncbi:antibiotic biosynthesis monooxygenase family protein [Corynebacterium variabile]|uniref:Antibiotic biosynthesis monooxygenase n=1 Tax=Corynebacterium variabile TaxID=1727 RepID=A0A4Y4C563_9CORY|nr:antibiotic biosynthesis monooxygenase [Corynebacterium variabile]GEC86277.1 antibiotic biosynthesis monooxygenase [Corynebacterium variabile]